jgi:hypothetical protein
MVVWKGSGESAAAGTPSRANPAAATDPVGKVEWLEMDLAPENGWWRGPINQPRLMPDGGD